MEGFLEEAPATYDLRRRHTSRATMKAMATIPHSRPAINPMLMPEPDEELPEEAAANGRVLAGDKEVAVAGRSEMLSKAVVVVVLLSLGKELGIILSVVVVVVVADPGLPAAVVEAVPPSGALVEVAADAVESMLVVIWEDWPPPLGGVVVDVVETMLLFVTWEVWPPITEVVLVDAAEAVDMLELTGECAVEVVTTVVPVIALVFETVEEVAADVAVGVAELAAPVPLPVVVTIDETGIVVVPVDEAGTGLDERVLLEL